MRIFLLRFGVKEKDIPALAKRDIGSLDELASLYFSYCDGATQRKLASIGLKPSGTSVEESKEEEIRSPKESNRVSNVEVDLVQFCNEEDLVEEENTEFERFKVRLRKFKRE